MFSKEDILKIWEDIKVKLCGKPNFGSAMVELWLIPLELLSFDNGKISFTCPSKYKTAIINSKYIDTISEAFEPYLDYLPEVEIFYKDRETGEILYKHITVGSPESRAGQITDFSKIRPKDEENKSEITPFFRELPADDMKPFSDEKSFEGDSSEENDELPKSKKNLLPPLNFEYTFENFIEGSSNSFARAACWAVATNVVEAEEGCTASQYNPLFLYGPSGIGKTHLMYAITNKISKERPEAHITYIKGEDFTNELIESLSHQSMNKFREKYRHCDILMIDDIQFIAGKVSTQEEFFHTFNALYENEKQIIMTSDRPPREINDLEKRLVSRFEMGLLADIQPPDIELRTAIIKKKAEQGNVKIPDDVLVFLAENLRSNIRQIEGAIKKLSALSFLSGKTITLDVASNLLSELLGGAEPIGVTVDKIFLSLYQKYGISREDLVGGVRTRDIAKTRHIAIYLIRHITEMSFPNIGKIFNRDHTTIMASYDNIEKRMVKENMFAVEINELVKEIENMGK